MPLSSEALDYESLLYHLDAVDLRLIRDIDFRELTLAAAYQESSFLQVDLRRQFMYGMGVMDIRTRGFWIFKNGSPVFVASLIPDADDVKTATLAGYGSQRAAEELSSREKVDVALLALKHILASPYDTFYCHAHETNMQARNLWSYLAKKTGEFSVTEGPSEELENFVKLTLERY